MSGDSPCCTRLMPFSASKRATVEVSAKFNLQPNVWKRALCPGNVSGSVTVKIILWLQSYMFFTAASSVLQRFVLFLQNQQ
jgi:hypothetical protein